MSLPSPRQQSPAFSTEEELAQMMRQVTPLDDEENNDDPFIGGGQQASSSPTHGTATSVDAEADGMTPSSGTLRSNEQCVARRLADRLNLFPYQKEALNALVKVCWCCIILYNLQLTGQTIESSSVGQNVLLYSQQCVIENKLDRIIAAAPLYKVTPALKVCRFRDV